MNTTIHLFRFGSTTCFAPKGHHHVGKNGRLNTQFRIEIAISISYNNIYRVSQEERTKLREGVPYVKLYRYNPKRLYPKLNGYRDNGKSSLKL